MENSQNFQRFFDDNPPTFSSKESTRVRIGGKFFNYEDPESVAKLISPEVALKYDLIEWYKNDSPQKYIEFKEWIEETFRRELVEQREQNAKIQKAIEENEVFELPDVQYVYNEDALGCDPGGHYDPRNRLRLHRARSGSSGYKDT